MPVTFPAMWSDAKKIEHADLHRCNLMPWDGLPNFAFLNPASTSTGHCDAAMTGRHEHVINTRQTSAS